MEVPGAQASEANTPTTRDAASGTRNPSPDNCEEAI